jgi:hypothetical protein
LAPVAAVRANADGEFTVRVPRPARGLVASARFEARVGGFSSARLKLPQSLNSSSIGLRGRQVEIRGRVKPSLLGRRSPVVVKQLLCGRYRIAGRARPDRRGRYVVRFEAPSSAALYRAESRVLARRGSTRYVRRYARAIGIAAVARPR